VREIDATHEATSVSDRDLWIEPEDPGLDQQSARAGLECVRRTAVEQGDPVPYDR
jgi:hypothetical protein